MVNRNRGGGDSGGQNWEGPPGKKKTKAQKRGGFQMNGKQNIRKQIKGKAKQRESGPKRRGDHPKNERGILEEKICGVLDKKRGPICGTNKKKVS